MSNDIYDILTEMNKQDGLTEENIMFLKRCASSRDWEIRNITAETLVLSDSSRARDILYMLARDKNSLVRTNACDSLSVFDDKETLFLLLKRAQRDKSFLVRAYSVMSAYDVGMQSGCEGKLLEEAFESMLPKEKNDVVKISLYASLYKLGGGEHLKKICKNLYSKNYRTRCFAVNTLSEFKDGADGELVKERIQRLRAHEKSRAVLSTIARNFGE